MQCGVNEVCQNRINASYACICASGYERDSDELCSNINECDGDHGCEHGCRDNEGSYECICLDGFQQNEEGMCEDIDECELETDKCVQDCENTAGSYTCSCGDGYEIKVKN